jgi:hypothetical protein
LQLAPYREASQHFGAMRFAFRHLPIWMACAGSISSLPGRAVACPNCETSRLVRASMLDDRFWDNLLAVSLPLVILGVITALLYRLGLDEPNITPERREAVKENR